MLHPRFQDQEPPGYPGRFSLLHILDVVTNATDLEFSAEIWQRWRRAIDLSPGRQHHSTEAERLGSSKQAVQLSGA
jgi:hypothetical protein